MFDKVTDTIISKLLDTNESFSDISVIKDWLIREGSEVYVYDSTMDFIDRVTKASKKVGASVSVINNRPHNAIERINRDYYTSYLFETLGQAALQDAKLKIQFMKGL